MDNYSVKKKLVGKEVEFILHDTDMIVGEIIADEAYQEGLRLQKIFNFFDSDSELSKLNRKRHLKVSNELLSLIKKALEFSKITDGQYDISIGKQILQRKSGKKITKIGCSYKDISIEKDTVILKHPDVLIDLSSLAKGYIVDRMADILKSGGIMSGLIDARGDILTFGDDIEIGIQHPRDKENIIAYIKAKNMAIATSGDYNQYDKTYEDTHILNNKKLISVTVIADDLMTADIFATVIFVSDDVKRAFLLKKEKSINVMTIDKNMEISYYNGFEKLLMRDIY